MPVMVEFAFEPKQRVRFLLGNREGVVKGCYLDEDGIRRAHVWCNEGAKTIEHWVREDELAAGPQG